MTANRMLKTSYRVNCHRKTVRIRYTKITFERLIHHISRQFVRTFGAYIYIRVVKKHLHLRMRCRESGIVRKVAPKVVGYGCVVPSVIGRAVVLYPLGRFFDMNFVRRIRLRESEKCVEGDKNEYLKFFRQDL